eukprot:jgi/Hompol1/6926/HPOL_002118-RA
MSAAAANEQHLLSLKVLRLSRPGFGPTTPLYAEDRPELPANSALLLPHSQPQPQPQQQTDQDAAPSTTIEATEIETDGLDSLGSLLTLPASFGNIYLGETFSSYLCVNNESSTAVLDVAFKAELQTTTQRFTLADTLAASASASSPVQPQPEPTASAAARGSRSSLANFSTSQSSLLPAQSAEFVIHHDLKELGIHILVCSVHYTPASASASASQPGPGTIGHGETERKFFRKFYKFQVLNPLSVKTKVNTLQDGRVFLETQVQNVSAAPMYLERMLFDPADPFTFEDLNSIKSVSGSSDASVFGDEGLLGQQDTRQYLYMLTPKIPTDVSSRMVPGLGKLDISWRTQMGQSGRLQTSQLSRKAPSIDPFDVSVISQPAEIRVEQPFKITVRLRSHLPNERMRLSIHGQKTKMANILLRGSNDIDLGGLDGVSHIDVDLEFLALAPGLQQITGLRISEKISGASKELSPLAVVRVV